MPLQRSVHEAPEGLFVLEVNRGGAGYPLGPATTAIPGADALIVVAGPTASGKTELSVELARRLGGEVISADSRQVYRELSAGTAKPNLDRLGRLDGIPYHLTDLVGPESAFDAGAFGRLAREKAGEIQGRGRRAIVAGGTGLYLRALLQGLSELPKADPGLRRRILDDAGRFPDAKARIHERLAAVDPAAAREIPPGNIQRVIRALEIHSLTGRPFTQLRESAPRPPALEAEIFRIEWPAPVLRERIMRRARLCWPRMLEEARGLAARYGGTEPGFQSLGYPEALACVRGTLGPEEGLSRMIRATLAYAKRQRTWLRHQLESAEIPGARAEAMAERIISLLKK